MNFSETLNPWFKGLQLNLETCPRIILTNNIKFKQNKMDLILLIEARRTKKFNGFLMTQNTSQWQQVRSNHSTLPLPSWGTWKIKPKITKRSLMRTIFREATQRMENKLQINQVTTSTWWTCVVQLKPRESRLSKLAPPNQRPKSARSTPWTPSSPKMH